MLETTQVFTVLAGLLTFGILVCWILYNSNFITQKKLANTCEFSKIKETESNEEESKIIQTRDKTAQKESKAIQTETKTVQTESKVIQTKIAQKESKAIQTEIKTVQMKSKVIQTKNVQKESKAIQTGQLKFTERMANFDTEQIDSAELFDNCCEICIPMLEKEAVGFCKNCEKFMCLNCCKHHEKIPLSNSHVLIDKKDYVKREVPKIVKVLVPIQTLTFEGCQNNCLTKKYSFCSKEHYVNVLGLGNIPDSREIGCIIQSCKCDIGTDLTCRYQDIKTGKMQVSYMMRNAGYDNSAHDFCTTNSFTNDTRNKRQNKVKNAIYLTMPKVSSVWKYACYSEDDWLHYKAFSTCGACYGVAEFDNGLAISVFLPTSFSLPDWQVQYVTYDGNIKRRIYYDDKGQPLFKEPKFLTSNDARDILYVSDKAACSIIALDKNGTVLFNFTHKTMTCPLGLTCDDEGNIYVACKINVIQINAYGTLSRVILSPKENMSTLLTDICFNKLSQKLAVVNEPSEVTIFKFFPK